MTSNIIRAVPLEKTPKWRCQLHCHTNQMTTQLLLSACGDEKATVVQDRKLVRILAASASIPLGGMLMSPTGASGVSDPQFQERPTLEHEQSYTGRGNAQDSQRKNCSEQESTPKDLLLRQSSDFASLAKNQMRLDGTPCECQAERNKNPTNWKFPKPTTDRTINE